MVRIKAKAQKTESRMGHVPWRLGGVKAHHLRMTPRPPAVNGLEDLKPIGNARAEVVSGIGDKV